MTKKTIKLKLMRMRARAWCSGVKRLPSCRAVKVVIPFRSLHMASVQVAACFVCTRSGLPCSLHLECVIVFLLIIVHQHLAVYVIIIIDFM